VDYVFIFLFIQLKYRSFQFFKMRIKALEI